MIVEQKKIKIYGIWKWNVENWMVLFGISLWFEISGSYMTALV